MTGPRRQAAPGSSGQQPRCAASEGVFVMYPVVHGGWPVHPMSYPMICGEGLEAGCDRPDTLPQRVAEYKRSALDRYLTVKPGDVDYVEPS